jgi:hypothetical protein
VWFGLALVFNLVLGLSLAVANYDLGAIYERVMPPPLVHGSFLVNGELGFRYRMTRAGGRMLETTTLAEPGQWIVRSDLCLGGDRGSPAEASAVLVSVADFSSRHSLRLMDRHAHAGFYSAGFGWLPFSFSAEPLDTIRYYRVSPYINLPAAWTPTQIDGRLVYLPQNSAPIRLPLEDGARILRAVLYNRGPGEAHFQIQGDEGTVLLDRTVTGKSWEPVQLLIQGRGEVTLSLLSAAGSPAGWGELVTF